MIENTTTTLNRKYSLSREDLIERLKAVGQSIIDDADKLTIDSRMTAGIEINVDIKPCEEITTVDWHIERIADPRVRGAE